ncbi:hypothetical protein [Streptomyces bluensis]|uniref:hypothetical protein n=1 Tax=Streptomyces bluensis TaxID=33897 RepID=UPI0019ADFF7A|nr:hypothetical protein [Streptomyces bluensis]GGZ40894.1 hypothetical protein GCM10010344_01840 [Streptomyces bluensis]
MECCNLVQLSPVPRERPAQRLVEAEKRGGLLLGVGAEPFRRQRPRCLPGAAGLVAQQGVAAPADHGHGRDLRVPLSDGDDVGERAEACVVPREW